MTWMVTDTLLRLLVSCQVRSEHSKCILYFTIQKSKSKKKEKNKNPKKCLIHAQTGKSVSRSS